MQESGTQIIVNQPINGVTQRTISVMGKYASIAKACSLVFLIQLFFQVCDLIE